MLLLGMSVMLCSCEKAITDDVKDIEGRWYVFEKQQDLFNGQPVKDYEEFYIAKLFFQNGNMKMVQDDGMSFVFPYTIVDNKLTFFATTLILLKANKKEFVAQAPYSYSYFDGDTEYDRVLTKYNGVDIYAHYYMTTSGGYPYIHYNEVFWYYDKNGNRVKCKYLFGGIECNKVFDEQNELYIDQLTLSDIEYWYDMERYYFKAE